MNRFSCLLVQRPWQQTCFFNHQHFFNTKWHHICSFSPIKTLTAGLSHTTRAKSAGVSNPSPMEFLSGGNISSVYLKRWMRQLFFSCWKSCLRNFRGLVMGPKPSFLRHGLMMFIDAVFELCSENADREQSLSLKEVVMEEHYKLK